jgi:Alpha/beta hydrolase
VPGISAGEPAPAPAAARDALRHAAWAAEAAAGTGDGLAGLGIRDAFGPADFEDLLARVPLTGPFVAPALPAPRPPDEVARWWTGLSAAAQLAAIAQTPGRIGALDGLPAWARDRANRLLLDRALADPRTPALAAFTAGVVARRVAAEEAAGNEVQLTLLDLAGDRVVMALGDLDAADAVAVLVPGIGNSPADDLGALVRQARHVGAAARDAAPAATTAVAVWLGYRPPATVSATITRTAAWRGGPALAATLAGLSAARSATGGARLRTTVVAHSYGTVVVDEAADVPGTLAADAVVLLGSPGMEDDAASLEAPLVVDGVAAGDVVPRLHWFGDGGTLDPDYGAEELPVAPGMGHSDYLDPGCPTLAAIGQVVTGERPP